MIFSILPGLILLFFIVLILYITIMLAVKDGINNSKMYNDNYSIKDLFFDKKNRKDE
ncbi:hypothetical protein [Mycoplasma sp. P36-A1]|uniref:hypothetical protein n=1 Tax=Mycoplasma sp. P36-A1 TaxID=3252900 RepID=UPI003C2F6C49